MDAEEGGPVVALSGGVGGAKLALGLDRVLKPGQLSVVTNTGDDFEHLGLYIAPDLDSVMYTLAGINNEKTGWGRALETWSFMQALKEFGGETWFRLGDRDVALHVLRSGRLKHGATLGDFTREMCQRLNLRSAIIPMSDDPVRTVIETANGDLPFQEYFVKERCQPTVSGVRFTGADAARPAGRFIELLKDPTLAAIIIAPSNPLISIDPILALLGVKEGLRNSQAPIVAVSPIVRGRALKGPTGKMLRDLGMRCDAVQIAMHYRDLISGLVIDEGDRHLSPEIEDLGIRVLVAGTVMLSRRDKESLAGNVLAFARQLRAPNNR